jgi:NTP pyrophosphatase (non-canonical NTP hydrolase)
VVTSEASRPSTQDRVRQTLDRVGGYWRPLAAAARLLEELGELGEQRMDSGDDRELADDELADLWIITTAMADQFRGRVAEPDTHRLRELGAGDRFTRLVMLAGRIGRIVNYYDGPKKPRSFDGWISLEKAVRDFHLVLADVARAQHLDLGQAIDDKLDAIPELERGRFRRGYDASTAPVLRRFRAIQERTQCPYAARARLLGAPEWSRRSFDANVSDIIPSLTLFTKAAVPERLDAFVIPGPAFSSMEELADWFRRLLTELSRYDPCEQAVMDAQVDRPGWQFAFNGQRLFVAVFSPLYGPEHPRHSADDTYLFMQAEESFDRKGVGSAYSRSSRIKDEIRQQFAAAGQPYQGDLQDHRIEAPLYLLPRWDGDSAVRWWEAAG